MLQKLSSAAVVIGALRVNSLPSAHAFLSSGEFFSKSTVLNYFLRNTSRVSNSLEPDQAQHFVGPDLVLNCLQRLSADDGIKGTVILEIFLKLGFHFSLYFSIQCRSL